MIGGGKLLCGETVDDEGFEETSPKLPNAPTACFNFGVLVLLEF